jgi:hypothetical protein
MSKLLRFMEQDAPTASKVYHAWFLVQSAIEELEGVPAKLKDEILACVAHRWDYGYHMIQGAGYVLDPEFRLCEPPEECMDSFNEFVLKCYPTPDEAKFADAAAYDLACDEHTELLATIDRQLLEYRRGDGAWGRPAVLRNAQMVSAVDFWDMYGHMPLQRVALRALGCVSGACAAERGHKEMNFIVSPVRNCLGWLKAEKLIYLRMNLEILNRAVDYSSITNPMFELDPAVMEEMELPSAWREQDVEEAEEERAAAVKRSAARAAKLTANKAAAARGAPAPRAPGEREEGRRAIRRPRTLDEFE